MNKLITLAHDMTTTLFTEEDTEHPSTLQAYRNTKNKLYIEIASDDYPEDWMMMQFITLGLDDAKKLVEVLQEAINDMKDCNVRSNDGGPRADVSQVFAKQKKEDPTSRKYVNGQLQVNGSK